MKRVLEYLLMLYNSNYKLGNLDKKNWRKTTDSIESECYIVVKFRFSNSHST